MCVLGFAAVAEAGLDEDSRACQECHELAGWVIKDPVRERVLNLTIDTPAYEASSHGALPCSACHERGFNEIPHRGAGFYPVFHCVGCHRDDPKTERFGFEQRKAELKESVHGSLSADPLECHTCHDPHRFREVNAAEAQDRVESSNALCRQCHGPGATHPKRLQSEAVASWHSHLPNRDHHFRRLKCVACHTEHGADTFHEVQPATDAVADCTNCHSRGAQALSTGHAAQAVAGRGASETIAAPEVVREGRAYVVGMSRSRWLDRASVAGFFAAIGALAIHAGLRRARRRVPEPKPSKPPGPTWVRVWHALHAVVFFVLLASGLSMHFSGTPAALPFRWSVTVHNLAGVAMIGAWLVAVVAGVATGYVRNYVQGGRRMIRNALEQARGFGASLADGEARDSLRPPGARFNPIQQVVYTGVVYVMLPLVVASGGLLLFPIWAPERAIGGPGLWPMALLHLSVGYLLTIFAFFHVYAAVNEAWQRRRERR